MKQVYIISIRCRNKKKSDFNCFFKDYAEARKIALHIIHQKNDTVKTADQQGSDADLKTISYLQEIVPDMWVDENQIIAVKAILVKKEKRMEHYMY